MSSQNEDISIDINKPACVDGAQQPVDPEDSPHITAPPSMDDDDTIDLIPDETDEVNSMDTEQQSVADFDMSGEAAKKGPGRPRKDIPSPVITIKKKG